MNDIPLFDGHCDTLYRLTMRPQETMSTAQGQWNLTKLNKFGPQAQFFAVFWDSKTPLTKMMVKRQMKNFKRECRIHADRMTHCRTAEEARKAFSEGKVAAFLSVEGAELIGCSLEGLQKAYDEGVRAVNLTWNHANSLAGSHCDKPQQGLTEQGRAFVQKAQKLGMLIDVSHLSDAAFWDLMEITKKPIIATHSNSRSVWPHTRNLTDEQFKAIAKYHGVVGLNVYTRFLGGDVVTERNLLAHLEHFLSLDGERSVGLGGDWDGCDSLPEGYDGIWSWAHFYETLLKQGYSEELVRNLFFNNMMRVVSKTLS